MGETRESWGSTVSFILACVGYAVGLGNIWRFPYLAYKSGGGAFLIPYVTMLILCGIPLLYMELSVGQYTRRGPIGALGKLSPILKGAGVATVVMSFLLSTYYNVIMSWALFYLFSSFSSTLPWETCTNSWNSPECRPIKGEINSTEKMMINSSSVVDTSRSSTQEFYDRRMLNLSSGIEEMGAFNLELFGLLVIAWILTYFCIWKSVKATGKVVYFTATIPFLLLIIFTVRGLTLEGASDGLTFFFKPVWSEVVKPKVWVYAAAQVFNSVGIAFGSLIAFASYNEFKGPILRNALIVTVIDAFTCILCGVCVFATLGNLAHLQGTTVNKVVTEGPGLVFVVFPHALSQLPLPQFWSVIFFAMLVCLGIDSQFAIVEVVITSLKDGYGEVIDKYIKRHELVVLLVCIVSLLCGLPHMFQGGIYFFQIIDYYTAAISLMYIALFETIAIVWVYGTKRLSMNIEDMTGKKPNFIFQVCWMFISPVLICVIWVFTLLDYKTPSYNGGAYTYPGWCILLGWFIASLSILPIPIMAVVSVVNSKGTSFLEKFRRSCVSKIGACPCCDVKLNSKFQAHVDIQPEDQHADEQHL
eukprot:GFUD01008989.1.p1 GENE.GFUD01008989.1~~GFUD01008989.1.p1  ORF type:complete len:587 (-),score=78.05 GFUD01008989.1:299-2059(-)